MTTASPITFNPFDPEFRADPYPIYRRLRQEAPVYYMEAVDLYVLSRYDDAAALLRHPKASTDDQKAPDFRDRVLAMGMDPDQVIAESTRPFLFMDPPDHTRLRALVNKAFTPKVVETLRPRIEKWVDDLLDAAEQRGEMDIIPDIAFLLPVYVICDLLGVPAEDAPRFKVWSNVAARSLDPDFVLAPEEVELRERTFQEFGDYMEGLIAQRRKEPRDDLLSHLIAAEEAGDKLTHDELRSTCILLLIAGHETTVNLIGNGMQALMRNPDQAQRLRDDPSLIKTAVEELLRFDPPVQLTGRRAIGGDIELPSMTLRDGKQAILLLGAANRDPDQFPQPESLDVGRQDNRHLAFGMGIHFCLGAPLARVEGQIAISEMVRRFPAMRMLEDPPPYKPNFTLRGLASLKVALE
jgi:cytochrome P450